MRQELDRALCKKFPLIFKDRHGDMRSTLICWGFDCGNGWYDLLDSACALMYWPYKRAAKEYQDARSNEGTVPYEGSDIVTAVEVERARLTMAKAAAAVPVAIQVKEKYGTLRFYTRGGDDRTSAIIEFAEYHSGKICEVCGAPGRSNGHGWIRVRCDAHRDFS